MSSTQEIDGLLDQIDNFIHAPRGKEILAAIRERVAHFDRQAAYKTLVASPGVEGVDRLETLTRESFVPYPGQDNAAKTDMKRYFILMRRSYGAYPENFQELLDMYPEIFPFDGKPKKRCGALRSTCIMSTDHDEHRFESADQYECPVCGAPRSLCRSAPRSTGRCASHGGRAAASPRMTKGMLYREHMTNPHAVEAMERLERDNDAISMAAEVHLLTTRVTELMDEVESGIDTKTLLKHMEASRKRMMKHIDSDSPEGAIGEIANITKLLESRERADRKWDQILETIRVMGVQADRERKRIAMEKQLIPLERALQLQDETIEQIRLALEAAARKISSRLVSILEYKVIPTLALPEKTRDAVLAGFEDRREEIASGVVTTYEQAIERWMAEREQNLNQTTPHTIGISEVAGVIEGEFS